MLTSFLTFHSSQVSFLNMHSISTFVPSSTSFFQHDYTIQNLTFLKKAATNESIQRESKNECTHTPGLSQPNSTEPRQRSDHKRSLSKCAQNAFDCKPNNKNDFVWKFDISRPNKNRTRQNCVT